MIRYNKKIISNLYDFELYNNKLGFIVLTENDKDYFDKFINNYSGMTLNLAYVKYSVFFNITDIVFKNDEHLIHSVINLKSKIHNVNNMSYALNSFKNVIISDADKIYNGYNLKSEEKSYIRRLKLERLI